MDEALEVDAADEVRSQQLAAERPQETIGFTELRSASAL
jgi:hypothetical protein